LAATAEAFFLTVADQHPARQISALLFKLGEAGSSEIIRAKRVALSVRLRTYAGDRLELAVKTGLLPATFDILPATLAYEAYVFGVLESWLIAPSFDLIAPRWSAKLLHLWSPQTPPPEGALQVM
jgi:hypothetical protein